MYISLNWLKDYVDLSIDQSGSSLENVVVGYVKTVTKHPNADSLNIAEVDIGNETVTIVCGGVNLTKDTYVPVALPGAVLPGNFKIKKAKIRDIESSGMICHLSELGLAKEEGKEISIIEKAKPGTPFSKTLKNSLTPKEFASDLTLKTAEVEGFLSDKEKLANVVTGKLVSFKKIEGTKHHHSAKIDIGNKEISLVFGSVHKLEEGWILPIALVGAKLPGGEIKEVEIQGTLSQGMVATDEELGIAKSPTGLTVFPENTPLGIPVAEILELDDIVIEIDNKSLTHRPDLWGHYGIAREVSAIYQTPLKPFEPSPKLPTKGEQVKVDIENYDLCPRYCGVIIKNIKVQESPSWIKQRLQAAGHQTYNNIVDITNFISSELGQPLHAFDKNLIEDGIVVRLAKKDEKMTTLDGKERKFTEEMLLIADHKKPVAIAGVMGGANSEITPDTTEIIIESATFLGSNIRRTSTDLGLRTEAVQRFEKQLDPNLSLTAIQRAIELILEVSPGAEVAGPITDNHKFDDKPKTLTLNVEKAQLKIGVPIKKAEMKDILERLQFKVTSPKTTAKDAPETLEITVPSFRAQKDVTIEADLVEEIARIYGYDKIPATLPLLPTKLPEPNIERTTKHELRKFIAYGLGLNEIYTYSFYSKPDLENAGLEETGHLLMDNPLSEDQSHMRISLAPNVLKKIELNAKYNEQFQLFEVGRTYKDLGKYFPLEEKWITGAYVQTAKKKESPEAASAPFYAAKQAATKILEHLRIPFYKIAKDTNLPYAHPNKAITILSPKGETLGSVFLLHPQIAKNFGLENQHVAMFELNLTLLTALDKKAIKFKELPKFPPIQIDVSVTVDKTIEIEKVRQAILKADKNLITNVTLFDLYEGENLGPDKKSLAFSVTLQSPDKTLTDTEMTTTQQNIFANLKKIGGEVRGA